MTSPKPNPRLTDADVRDWLVEHPEFLADHPEVLTVQVVPHEAGTASLIERQVELLRTENQRLKRQLSHLSGVAGENERLMQRLHKLSLQLMAAGSAREMIERLCRGLKEDFRADSVYLMLGSGDGELHAIDGIVAMPEEHPRWLANLLASAKPQCGRLTRTKRELVFGTAGGELGSAALVPLGEHDLLAIGAESPDRFHPDMGTLFLELLRETLRFRLDMDADQNRERRARA
ncbi:MAG: DUF484 family protein [Wenzhouxiangellaceae bacterium]|nr:DUF484 family protein [Wenzhouxiangellaceae bacterium]